MDFDSCTDDFGREVSIPQLRNLKPQRAQKDRKVRKDCVANPVLEHLRALREIFLALFAVKPGERGTSRMYKPPANHPEMTFQHHPDRFAVRNMLLLQNARC